MDTRAAYVEGAARDGVVLAPATFDWLCEQGHVGLERVARACRDSPASLRERAYCHALAPLAG